MTYAEIVRVYEGSDGDATRRLYAALQSLGPIGYVALNLCRAAKCSARAKLYRGGVRGQGSFRSMAYERKQYSLDQLCAILIVNAISLRMTWGWAADPAAEYHKWVLYVDLPTGQVSFHTDRRGPGPDYKHEWDGVLNASSTRILQWTASLFAAERSQAGVSA